MSDGRSSDVRAAPGRMVATPDVLARHAAEYAARGWPVLPVWWPLANGACACGQLGCSKPGKHPLSRHGCYDASTDPDRIRRWWKRWPQANVGIRTGTGSGLLVVDVDGPDGMHAVRALRREHGPLPAAWVRTGSGGWHAYLRLPQGQVVGNSVRRLGPCLDVRSEGGSIVAPPSRHASGGQYAWLRPGVEPPPAPDWLIELALAPPPPPLQPVRELVGDGLDGYAAAAINGEAEAVANAPAGTRNAAAAAAGLPLHESAATVRSGMRGGLQRPRQPAPSTIVPAARPRSISR